MYQQPSYQSPVIFVGGLSLSASARDVGIHFSQYGNVLQVDLPLSRNGDRKGFAFVHFASPEGVELALQEKNHEIKGKRVAVRRGLDQAQASQETKNMQERKIFAAGFPDYATEESVFVLVSPFGKIAKILSPKGGIGKRGFCYIVMRDKICFDNMIELGGLYIDEDHYVTFTPASTKSALKSTDAVKRASMSSGSHKGQQQFVAEKGNSIHKSSQQARTSSFGGVTHPPSSNITGSQTCYEPFAS